MEGVFARAGGEGEGVSVGELVCACCELARGVGGREGEVVGRAG